MARKHVSGGELPCIEERRRILQRAGTILDQARTLVARLDLHESTFPRSGREHQQALDATGRPRIRNPFSTNVPRPNRPTGSNQQPDL